MKTLSSTLLAAQKKPDRLPYVEAKVYDFDQGIKRLSWTRLYEGSEPDNHHGLAFDGEGSMHRIRVNGNNLYRQKVASPGEASDYSQWTQLAADCYGPCAIAAYGAKIYIFYRTTGNVLWKYYSHNYGQDWSNAQLVTAYTDVLSMAATWWGTGNIVVCFAFKAGQQNGIVIDTTDQSTGEHTWLGSVLHPWGDNFGAGCYYTPDHVDLVVAAWESGDPYNLYGLYRQQFDNAYTFTDVDPFITAPEGEGITYEFPDCHKPAAAEDYENTLIVGVEKFTGTTAYTRPLICHAVRESDFYSMAFTEPKPFLNISSTYGLRLQSTAGYWWLERPDGVWRAPRAAAAPLDLTPDIVSLRAERGNLVIELDNSRAQYSTPPEKRSEVVLKLGYRTTAGSEAYLKDLRADEESSYSYGADHVILQGEYRQAVPLTRARAIGRDAGDARIVEDAIDWTNLQLGIDIFDQDYDPNLQTAARAQERADAILRKESLRAQGGRIVIPPNVGQELYDVATVTDKRCGITNKKYRVMDIDVNYSLREWQYRQTLTLGAP